jgi:transposase
VTVERTTGCLQLRTTAANASCPRWATRSSALHRHDHRHLRALPWGPCPSRLQRTVRTCEGRHASGPSRLCTARVPELVAPSARTPPRPSAALQALGVARGGPAGVRLAPRLGLLARRDTRRRRARRLPLPVIPPWQASGVDEGAPRKRQREGPLVVDRARHQPVALLHDREADTLATGVHAHPGRTLSARDRLKA